MSFFTPRREPRHCSRPCSRFFLSCLKVPLAHRHARPSILDFDGEDSEDDYDRMVTLTVGEYAMEAAKVRGRRRLTMATRRSLNSVVSPMAGELFIAAAKGRKDQDEEEEESEEAFLSAGSRCSSVSRNAYFSPEGSRCSSVKSSVEVVGWESLGRRSILEELCHCSSVSITQICFGASQKNSRVEYYLETACQEYFPILYNRGWSTVRG